MWVSRKIGNDSGGKIISSAVLTGGDIPSLSEGGITPECLAPYGYRYSLPSGQQAVLMEDKLLGVKYSKEGLKAGEVKISSLGGASIYLRNDGYVVINGKAFAPEVTE